jgi:acyl-CoA hydrolase
VPVSYPICRSSDGLPGELQKRIASYIADLIPDGATMQMGIGEIPDAVLFYLKDKKDLGVHTELFSDGVIDLIDSGVLTNAAKTIHKEMRCRLCPGLSAICTITWTTIPVRIPSARLCQ